MRNASHSTPRTDEVVVFDGGGVAGTADGVAGDGGGVVAGAAGGGGVVAGAGGGVADGGSGVVAGPAGPNGGVVAGPAGPSGNVAGAGSAASVADVADGGSGVAGSAGPSGGVADAGGAASASGKPVGTMPVAERFISINGEGPNAGKQAAFIRFRGCNLDCSWCDTRWACLPDCPVEQLSLPSLVAFVTESDVRYVTLTGGEPLLQPLLGDLIRALLQVPHLTVEVETNGSLSVAALDEIRREPRGAASTSRLSFTMDWKLPGSGMEQRMDASRFAPLGSDDSVKFVVGSNEDIDAAARVIREANLDLRCRVFLSPVAGAIEPAQVVCRMTELHLNNVALQLQLHKIIWPNETKGV